MTDLAMTYEICVRRAFGGADKVGRNGDPSKLADTDCFSDSSLNLAKTGLAYATCFELNNPENNTNDERLESILDDILSALSISDLIPSLTALDEIQTTRI